MCKLVQATQSRVVSTTATTMGIATRILACATLDTLVRPVTTVQVVQMIAASRDFVSKGFATAIQVCFFDIVCCLLFVLCAHDI